MYSQHQQLYHNQTQSFNNVFSNLGANVLYNQTGKHRKTTRNSPKPFLPVVSGASAFSNYSNNTGHSTSILKKVKNNRKSKYSYEMKRIFQKLKLMRDSCNNIRLVDLNKREAISCKW